MKRVLLIVVLCALLAVPMMAQSVDPMAEPTYTTLTMTSAFAPDPIIVTIQGGGELNAASLGLADGCVGYVATAPDVRINLTEANTDFTLRFFVMAAADTTLVIQTPSGEYLCSDDNAIDGAVTASPVIDVTPEEGVYNVWIGSFTAPQSVEDFVPGYLFLTEYVDITYPGQIFSSYLGTVVLPE